MTQNEIEKKLKNIEKSLDKMSDNYDKTLSDIMIEQERQKTIKTLDKSDELDFELEERHKDKDFSRFLIKFGLIFGCILVCIALISSILTHFIPTV